MVTKRQLGLAIIGISGLALMGLFVVDFLGAGEWQGFGPLQWIGLGLCAASIVVGLILTRLGDRPA
jgi:hypothetical protein